MDIKKFAWWMAITAIVSLSAGAFLLRDVPFDIRERVAALEYREEKSVALGNAREIRVVSSSPGVIISPTAGSTLTAKVSGRFTPKPELIVTSDQESVLVELRINSTGMVRVTEGSFEVSIPREYAGALKVEVSSGSVRIRDFNLASLSVRSSSGSIRCDTVAAAKTDLKVSSGSITLNSHSGSVTAETSSGSITARVANPGDTIQLKSSSGSVQLNLPKDWSCGRAPLQEASRAAFPSHSRGRKET